MNLGSRGRAACYREFIINRPDYADTLKLRVYKKAKAMRLDSQSLDNRFKFNDDFSAVFHATHGMDCDADGFFTSSMFVIILLSEEDLTIAAVSHECLHAAFAHDRRINRYIGKYEHEHEERFARYFEWLLIKVLETLKAAGYKVN